MRTTAATATSAKSTATAIQIIRLRDVVGTPAGASMIGAGIGAGVAIGAAFATGAAGVGSRTDSIAMSRISEGGGGTDGGFGAGGAIAPKFTMLAGAMGRGAGGFGVASIFGSGGVFGITGGGAGVAFGGGGRDEGRIAASARTASGGTDGRDGIDTRLDSPEGSGIAFALRRARMRSPASLSTATDTRGGIASFDRTARRTAAAISAAVV